MYEPYPDEILVEVPVHDLRDWSPFVSTVWAIELPITREGVQRAIESGDTEKLTYSIIADDGSYDETWHERRVAHLVVNDWDDPIYLEASPNRGAWLVQDGNHRLAAAIYRGDDAILCSLGGYLDMFPELIGVTVE